MTTLTTRTFSSRAALDTALTERLARLSEALDGFAKELEKK